MQTSSQHSVEQHENESQGPLLIGIASHQHTKQSLFTAARYVQKKSLKGFFKWKKNFWIYIMACALIYILAGGVRRNYPELLSDNLYSTFSIVSMLVGIVCAGILYMFGKDYLFSNMSKLRKKTANMNYERPFEILFFVDYVKIITPQYELDLEWGDIYLTVTDKYLNVEIQDIVQNIEYKKLLKNYTADFYFPYSSLQNGKMIIEMARRQTSLFDYSRI